MNVNPISQPPYNHAYNINANASLSMKGCNSVFLKNINVQKSANGIFQKILTYFQNYSKRINYTWQHKKAFLKVEKELCGKNSISGYWHDLDKLIMYIVGIPKNKAHDIHVAHSPHHIQNGKIKKPIMAVIDWESARYTKPDKPLSAREYYEKQCPKMPEVEEAFKKLGL